MTSNNQELLQMLRHELTFLEQGGYRQRVKGDRAPLLLKDSPTCLNYGDELRAHACHECSLFTFVPDDAKAEDVPCHFIPLDEQGRNIAELMKQAPPGELETALKNWLQGTIARLEAETLAC